MICLPAFFCDELVIKIRVVLRISELGLGKWLSGSVLGSQLWVLEFGSPESAISRMGLVASCIQSLGGRDGVPRANLLDLSVSSGFDWDVFPHWAKWTSNGTWFLITRSPYARIPTYTIATHANMTTYIHILYIFQTWNFEGGRKSSITSHPCP